MATDQQSSYSWDVRALNWAGFIVYFIGWAIILAESQSLGVAVTLITVAVGLIYKANERVDGDLTES